MIADKTAPKTIDEYITGFPPEVQEILQQVRKTIKAAAPDAEEAIKYQLPTFVLNGNLVHFGAFKKHIGFYPTPTGTEKFKKEINDARNSPALKVVDELLAKGAQVVYHDPKSASYIVLPLITSEKRST